MFSVNHEIAGIAFRTDYNTPLPYIQEKLFNNFRIDNKRIPDITNIILKLGPSDLNLQPPSKKGLEKLSGNFRSSAQGGLQSPLLRSFSVRESLSHSLERSCEEIDIRLEREQIIISNFSRRILTWYATPHIGEYPAEYHIAANLTKMFSTFLPAFSAVLIHSSGILVNNKAALFLSSGEGGKTTTARLASKFPILNDDYTVWRKDGGIIKAYPTPFGGISNATSGVPIGGLFLLEKSDSFSLSPVDRLELTCCLWHVHRYYTDFLTRKLKINALDIIAETCRKVPTYRMRFPKDHVDWDAIDKAMAK